MLEDKNIELELFETAFPSGRSSSTDSPRASLFLPANVNRDKAITEIQLFFAQMCSLFIYLEQKDEMQLLEETAKALAEDAKKDRPSAIGQKGVLFVR